MASAALRRLMAEYKQLLANSPDGLLAGPVSDENYFEWDAQITGPEGTPFEDGLFVARLVFPQDYPLNPPTMRIISEIFHPLNFNLKPVCTPGPKTYYTETELVCLSRRRQHWRRRISRLLKIALITLCSFMSRRHS